MSVTTNFEASYPTFGMFQGAVLLLLMPSISYILYRQVLAIDLLSTWQNVGDVGDTPLGTFGIHYTEYILHTADNRCYATLDSATGLSICHGWGTKCLQSWALE
eukprot:358554-Chlamydomonas_euryale.AAC.10